jgi:hypothetical protein
MLTGVLMNCRMVLFPAVVAVGCITLLSACGSHPNPGHRASRLRTSPVAEETLLAARMSGFDYLGTLKRARERDKGALNDLLNFSLHTDAASTIGHGIVLVCLIRDWGDVSFANAVTGESKQIRQAVLCGLEAGLYSGPDAPNTPPRDYAPVTYKALTRE